jgi:putative hydrolase of the HAD superfamily
MNAELRAVGFDLDYTLYDQDLFARSFFEGIKEELGRRLGLEPAQVASACLAALERLTLHEPRLFGAILQDLRRPDPELEAELVRRYRQHRPQLQAYPQAREILAWVKDQQRRLFLVTDGQGASQRHKLESLGLAPWFDAMIFTDELPVEQRKPSPVPFLRACAVLGIEPAACLFVGDDPQRDFEGPKLLGMRTVGVSTGPFADLPASGLQVPDARVAGLADLKGVL